jgi:hypothetical protein
MGVTKIKPSKFLKLLFLNKNMKTWEKVLVTLLAFLEMKQ